MFHSLKNKLTFMYMMLVLIIAMVGINSVVRLYALNRAIDGLMVDNYKSINATAQMLNDINDQNSFMIDYIHTQSKEALNNFSSCSNNFYKFLNIEENNITEGGEQELAKTLAAQYMNYMQLCTQIPQYRSKTSTEETVNYYNRVIFPTYKEITATLNKISSLNEKAMFANKEGVEASSRSATEFILILSVATVFIGLVFSRYLIKRYTSPISELTENIKAIKEGNLSQQVTIKTRDEIGLLASEFNNMTKRLSIYEQSTSGKLLAEKNRSLAIVKSISDPLVVLDSSYKIILLNKACEEFFSITEDLALNKYILLSIRSAPLYDHILEVIEKKSENNQRVISFQHNEKDYFFNVIVTAAKDESAKINDIVVLFQDITKMKELEKLKTNFISTISHEFKTPLNSIMLGTSLLLNENIGVINEKQIEIIKAMQDDGNKLAVLVTNLLQLSKIESDKSLFRMMPSSILGIINDCYRNFYDEARQKEINLYYEIDENLPKVVVDAEKISWVINNLISNALRFTNAGDEITITALVVDSKMQISVRDTGMGIPQDYIDKIFDKFVQVKGSDFESRGTGLGLSIAREIIEAHGESIWCESKLDMGSIFSFTLPLVEKE